MIIQNTGDASVASSIIMESLISRQNQTASRLDNIDGILSQILGAIKMGKVSNLSSDDNSNETRL